MKNSLNDNLSDNMILSHLSSKRKDYSIERYDIIFKKFDDDFRKLAEGIDKDFFKY